MRVALILIVCAGAMSTGCIAEPYVLWLWRASKLQESHEPLPDVCTFDSKDGRLIAINLKSASTARSQSTEPAQPIGQEAKLIRGMTPKQVERRLGSGHVMFENPGQYFAYYETFAVVVGFIRESGCEDELFEVWKCDPDESPPGNSFVAKWLSSR